MAQAFLHDLRMDALLEEQGRVEMAQVVERMRGSFVRACRMCLPFIRFSRWHS